MRVAFLLVALAIVAFTANAGLLFERTQVPKGWVMQGASPSHAIVNFTIGLKTQNDAELESLFWSVTDPTSSQYLQYPDTDYMEQRFGATAEDRTAVALWLKKAGGAMRVKHVASSIAVSTTVQTANKLFQTEIRQFKNVQTGAITHKAWGKYSLPEAIHSRVEIVTGISSFPVKRDNPYKIKPASAAAADEAVIPQTVAHMYSIREQKPQSDKKASQGVVEYEGQYFSNNDTAKFAKDVGYTNKNHTIAPIPASRVVGMNDPRQPGVESTLDVQWMAAVNLEAEMWFWIEDGTGWLYEFGTHILNFTAPPQVLSTSYGWWEGDQCSIDGDECQQLGVDSNGYVMAVNKLFQRIGMRGVSLLVASGDSGANGRTNGDCSIPQLRAAYPGSSPFVTTVGATQIVNGTYNVPNAPAICKRDFSCVYEGTETAVSVDYSSFTSGGGFSNVTGAGRPAYQEAAVSAYLSSGVMLPPASYFNASGRGEPDVAAVGHNGYIVVGGEANLVGGTSMASPIFAAVVSLLNEIAITKTGSSLGFLNPFLYKMAADMPSTFNDITVGDNICTEEGCSPGCKGFYAAKGWDPVTGLGTPNAMAMEAYVSKMLDEVLARRSTKTQ